MSLAQAYGEGKWSVGTSYNGRMKTKNILRALAVAALVLAASACSAPPAPSVTSTPTPRYELTPYQARTKTPSPAHITPATPTPLPSATPTPQTHVVVKGQDMFGIALYYGVSLEALQTANPTVNPNFLSIGTSLVIPGEGRPTPTVANPTPTALPVQTLDPNCLPSQEGGLWCFVAVTNPGDGRLESLSARLRLASPAGEYREVEAYSPLNLLEPGEQMPLAAYFSGPLPQEVQITGEILTALPVSDEDLRYLPARLEGIIFEVVSGGLSAEVSGEILVEGEAQAQTVWVVLTAYDAGGQVVGLRRWENEQPLLVGERLAFVAQVYSLGPVIARVEALVEARP